MNSNNQPCFDESVEPINIPSVLEVLENLAILLQAVSSQLWFYGTISRKDAGRRLKKDGDFLVRYSETIENFVLAVRQDHCIHHAVIPVDWIGMIKTRTKTFDSINGFIQYYLSGYPIVLRKAILHLKNPVVRTVKN